MCDKPFWFPLKVSIFFFVPSITYGFDQIQSLENRKKNKFRKNRKTKHNTQKTNVDFFVPHVCMPLYVKHIDRKCRIGSFGMSFDSWILLHCIYCRWYTQKSIQIQNKRTKTVPQAHSHISYCIVIMRHVKSMWDLLYTIQLCCTVCVKCEKWKPMNTF